MRIPEMYSLHLSDQGTFTPVDAQGGFHGKANAMKFTPYMYALLKIIILQFKKKMYRFKMAAK